MRDEDDYLLLSQLAHAGYCLRRAALIINEQAWKESVDTIKGHIEHERVHTQRIERRGSFIKLYEYDVFSEKMKLRGKCDCIEAAEHENGCMIPNVDFPVMLYPIEYKHGKIREEREYEIQLCAQAMCLEEMFQTTISEGALFYTSSHQRYTVIFSDSLRNEVKKIIEELRHIKNDFFIPQPIYSAKCKKCSLNEICMPQVKKTAMSYCEQLRKEAEGKE